MNVRNFFDLPPLTTRSYNPTTDAVAVKTNLEACGPYIEGQDNPERLAELVGRLPTAVLVVVAQDPLMHGNEIYGNANVTDGPPALIGRFSLSPLIRDPKARFEVARVLYNDIFAELRRRGAPWAEELIDIPRQDVMGHRQGFLSGLGFEPEWDIRSMVRPIWDEHGNPMPDIPPLNPAGDPRNLDVL
ncbi:MAG TPA: hypothetical protein VF733_05070 [Candidatus Saccharimonadales bacterium]